MRVDFQASRFSTINQSKSYQQRTLVNVGVKTLNSDVVSFGNSNAFWDLSSSEIIEKIDNSIKPENLLGRGGEASVYKLEDTDYCVRIPIDDPDDYKKSIKSELTDFEKINHGVAKLGEKTIIMKRIEGYSMFPRKDTGVTRAMVHSMIDDMPSSAYRNVIMQIANAREKGAYFDSSGANVIVNPVKKTMTVIDFTACEECANSRILKSLFITLGMNDGILTKTQQKDRANKILSAVIEDFLPGKKPFMRISDYSFSDFIYAVRNQGLISKAYGDVFINSLNELKELKYMSTRGVRDCENQMIFLVKKVKSLTRQLLT